MKLRIEDLKMVRVEAVDWATDPGTYEVGDKFEAVTGIIVGHEVEKTEDHITIALEGFIYSRSMHDSIRYCVSIPMVCVKSIEYLEVKK